MPINYSRYPANWNEIRIRILTRAKYHCEVCGVQNCATVYSFKRDGKTVWEEMDYGQWMRAGCPKPVTVVLTIAHLDHDETNTNVSDDRFQAMCQLCHLRYDAPEKARRRRERHGL